MEDRVVIITDSISVSAALVFWVFKHFSVQLHNLIVITQASLLEGSLCFKPGSVSCVISISTNSGFHTQLWLKELAKVLRPDGFLLVQEPSYLNHNKQLMIGDSRASLQRNLLFAGFYEIEGFPCLNNLDGIGIHSQNFELIAMRAKKSGLREAVLSLTYNTQPNSLPATETSSGGRVEAEPNQPEQAPNGPIARKRRSVPDPNDPKERIRERNRLYQRTRRARMSEEEKNVEKERRKQYMQNRRIRRLNASKDQPLRVR